MSNPAQVKLATVLATLGKKDRESLAAYCGVTVKYLNDLAHTDDPNPSGRVAFRLQDRTTFLAQSMPLSPVMARELCGAPHS